VSTLISNNIFGLAKYFTLHFFLCIMIMYRQYFENSSTQTAFIGYSTEMTALAVRKAAEQFDGKSNSLEVYKIDFNNTNFIISL